MELAIAAGIRELSIRAKKKAQKLREKASKTKKFYDSQSE